ncbi:hypothetical protein T484DRAFT_1985461, partial [Baffinella frigidus]
MFSNTPCILPGLSSHASPSSRARPPHPPAHSNHQQHAHGADVPRLGPGEQGRPRPGATRRQAFFPIDDELSRQVSWAQKHCDSCVPQARAGVRVLSPGFLPPPGPSLVLVPLPRRLQPCGVSSLWELPLEQTLPHGAHTESLRGRAELRAAPCDARTFAPCNPAQADPGTDHPAADAASEGAPQARRRRENHRVGPWGFPLRKGSAAPRACRANRRARPAAAAVGVSDEAPGAGCADRVPRSNAAGVWRCREAECVETGVMC